MRRRCNASDDTAAPSADGPVDGSCDASSGPSDAGRRDSFGSWIIIDDYKGEGGSAVPSQCCNTSTGDGGAAAVGSRGCAGQRQWLRSTASTIAARTKKPPSVRRLSRWISAGDQLNVERAMGIEPTSLAWEARVIAIIRRPQSALFYAVSGDLGKLRNAAAICMRVPGARSASTAATRAGRRGLNSG